MKSVVFQKSMLCSMHRGCEVLSLLSTFENARLGTIMLYFMGENNKVFGREVLLCLK